MMILVPAGLSPDSGLGKAVRERRTRFRRRLKTWAASHLKQYPWRTAGTSPYQILVAELLLKRTTATAAARAYDRFLNQFPSMESLESVPLEALRSAFQPIGLSNQRAVAVERLARYIAEVGQGQLPATLDALTSVPGLGPYGARALLSFGYGLREAVVDSNVVRILTRVFRQTLGTRPTPRVLQALADTLVPVQGHQLHNYAMLDLGSSVCRYEKPKCDQCPLLGVCDYGSGLARKT